jgi:hypothetical protein
MDTARRCYGRRQILHRDISKNKFIITDAEQEGDAEACSSTWIWQKSKENQVSIAFQGMIWDPFIYGGSSPIPPLEAPQSTQRK